MFERRREREEERERVETENFLMETVDSFHGNVVSENNNLEKLLK